MFRAISVTCVAAFLLGGASAAFAGGKQSVAVLGLEVKGDVDQPSIDAGKELTKQLRDRVNAGTSKYTMAGGSNKEYIDEKMILCNTETPACLTQIAGDVNAQVIIFGTLTHKGSDYTIKLSLFDTASQKLTPGPVERVQISQLGQGTQSQTLARKLYAEVSGESSSVTVTLRVKGSESGSVRVDGKLVGSYTSGQAIVTIAEGKVKIALEPNEKGLQRYENEITVAGPEMTKDIKIDAMPNKDPGDGSNTGPGNTDPTHEYGGTVSQGEAGAGWRKTVVVTAVATGVLGVGFGVSYAELRSTGQNPDGSYGKNCSKMGNTVTGPGQCSNGALWNDLTYATGIGAGVTGAIMLVAIYKGYISKGDPVSKEHADNGHRKKRDRFVVTPVVTPDGAGATVRLDW